MTEPATSIPLIIATLASLAATGMAVQRVRKPADGTKPLWPIQSLVSGVTALCLGAFVYRVSVVHQAWQPVQAHVDGLLLIGLLLAVSILYIQARPKLFGLTLFALPLLAIILLWGVCASLWTYRAFNLDSFAPAWTVFHLSATYLGLLGCGLGAAAGAMYLFVQGRLKNKSGLGQVSPMASLETLETLIVRSATLGFVLLTLSLVSGMVMVTQSEQASTLGKAWWFSPKVLLAASAWVVYAILINVRSFSTVRGRRAAWLAITGLILVLATYGAVEALDRNQQGESPKASHVQEAD